MTFSPKPIKDANEEKQPCRVLFYVLDHFVATHVGWGKRPHVSSKSLSQCTSLLLEIFFIAWKLSDSALLGKDKNTIL